MTFESRQVVTIGGQIIVPKTITAVLDGTGSIAIDLPSTNDPDLSVTGWAYLVTEHLPDARPPFLLEVPYTVGTIDLATAPQAAPVLSQQVRTGLYSTDLGQSVAEQSAVVAAQASADLIRSDLATATTGKGTDLAAYPDTVGPAYLKT